jgi:hypothetical protein
VPHRSRDRVTSRTPERIIGAEVAPMPARLQSSLALGCVLLAAAARAPAAQSPTLDDVLGRASMHLRSWMPSLVRLVAEEDYDQRAVVSEPGRTRTFTRRLKSDVLLVTYPGTTADWMLFRDVAAVDGKPVHHEPDRLVRLFVSPSQETTDRIRAIAAESVKYHFPGDTAAATNPFLAVALLQEHYRGRLRFSLGGSDGSIGKTARVVRFEEIAPAGERREPLFGKARAKGTLWIDEPTGRILKTETWPDGQDLGLTSTTATFRFDGGLGVMVPDEMWTTWRLTGQPSFVRGTVSGIASYSRFRRFQVDAKATVTVPKP